MEIIYWSIAVLALVTVIGAAVASHRLRFEGMSDAEKKARTKIARDTRFFTNDVEYEEYYQQRRRTIKERSFTGADFQDLMDRHEEEQSKDPN